MTCRRVGLYNLEPRVVNTALMQVSSFYKSKRYEVHLYPPVIGELMNFDKVFAFSIFDFTEKDRVKNFMITGGTGFDIYKTLPTEIEKCNYDWSFYPKCDFSILWFSRGCIRNCPFCIVRQKEGYIYPTEPKNLNPRGEYIKIQDNNFFASPEWKEAGKYLLKLGVPVEFSSGIDVRIFNDEQGKFLNKIRIIKQLHIAWDNPRENLVRDIKYLKKFIKSYKIMCYVLIGFWSSEEEDLYRVEKLRELNIDPFVMPYDKKDKYQRDFARWVNHKAIFKSVKWSEYRRSIKTK